MVVGGNKILPRIIKMCVIHSNAIEILVLYNHYIYYNNYSRVKTKINKTARIGLEYVGIFTSIRKVKNNRNTILITFTKNYIKIKNFI